MLFLILASSSLPVVFSSLSVQAATGINQQISFQGKVVNSNGTNVTNGSYTFVFRLYDVDTAGTHIWTESKSLTVTDGIFQTNLGDTTALPGSVDFNTDNIYLGINFNADGEMSPRVRFTAAPYAFNAKKVGGLTVTDTTGTLTIPNGKTISFADAFTTTGAFPLTLTTTASTTATLPSGTITLADLATSQSLTNKTIGSTGLVFSGAATDITTASGESLVIVAAGAGTIDIQDATTVDSLTTDTAGITIASGQSYSGSGAVTLASATASDLTINSGTTGTINIGTDASAETINIGNTGAAVKTIAIGNNTQANTITIGDASVTGLSLTDDNWSVSAGGAGAFVSLSASSAIAANGGITFDASTDTVGAFTAAGTIDANTNILTNIGNAGTDFIGTTGALTLAGVLTANGGVSLAGSQSFTASALSYIDLGSIVHNTTAVQGLRLPQAASATPSNPTSGEGYLAWDTAGNQLVVYNGASWSTIGGGSVSADSLDFTEFVDAMSLDANLTLAQGTNTWSQTFTGAATTGFSYTADSLTSGTAQALSSSATAFTGSLQSITLSGSDAANTGSLLSINNTGVLNANTALYLKHYGTGTNNLAFRIDDVSGDTTPFVVDGAGNVGVGTAAPTSLFELYGTGAADAIGTITAPDATYDPLLKLRTGASPAIQFTLGVDNSDSDKFKIYSGDGLGSGDEFVIDSNGVTTIANLNLGATNFDSDAGIISWINMPVTASSPVDTIESYTALIDDTDLLTIYAESDGSGGIQDKRVQMGSGGVGSTAPVLLALDVKSTTSDPTGFEGALYYNTFDNVFRCYQNAGWTNCIGSGGSSDLQTTYGNDADGSNVTVSLTAADDGLVFTNPTSGGNDFSTFLLQLDQANTTANMLALDIVQSSNASNAVNITANSIDGETGLTITTNGLTSGSGISVASSSAAMTGNLAQVTMSGSNAANTGDLLELSNTGTSNANTTLHIDHRATGTGNLALRVDDEVSDTTPFIIDGEGRVGIGTTAISTNAASERLLQVGSETNRGNMTAYGEIVSAGLDRHTALSGITDVFVYDTTGDSDGGRWVDWATTDNLSWYTEALDDGAADPCVISSDDRCYKASFPRKAILVVTTSALYIFDAATNDMWMKFSQNASGYALGVDTNNDPTSVTALNGVIYVGLKGTATTSLYAYDFVNDRMWNYDGTDRSGADTGISGRNAAVTYNVDNNTKLDLAVTGTAAEWQNVNDVSATVITHSISAAAVGATTNTTPGYGKVFLALATDSGVTVINLMAGTLNQYSDVAGDDYTAAVISRRGYLYALNTTQDQMERWDTIDTDKASEVAGTYTRKWDETIGTGPALASSAFNIVAPGPDNLEIAERASLTLDSEDVIYVGHSLGLAELHDHTTQAFGWVKHFNATRQTPMMPLAGINDMVLPMDDSSGTQAQDLAIANTDMAIKGTPTLGVNGVAGKGMNFDNTDDYLCSDADQNNACDVDTAFNMSTVGWTFSIWFRHSTTAPAAGADTIFEKCVTAVPAKATGCVIAYMTTTGTIVVANDTDATWTRPDEGAASYNITATSTYTYNDNQWHHLILSRTNANDLDSWIDGNGMNLSTATGGTTTFDGSQIVSIGASCVLTVTAACGAATNFWDGQLDDAQFVVGTTTQATVSALQARRLYNVERPRASKKTITVTDATSATSTSLTDTGESWFVNEFAGLIVEITGSTDTDCIGVTRRISGNTATALTFTPAVPVACTLDTTADFQVDPEKLYGASSSVAGIGITAESPLGEARQMCIGTNSGSDTGGVTCYNHQAGPSIVADVYHSQASQTDDTSTDWTGSNYDEMVAIDLSTRTLIMASEAHFTAVTEDVRLGQGLDYLANQLYMIRTEIIQDTITAVGSTGPEVGFTGGADLAENYYSDTPLEAGTVVALDEKQSAYVHEVSGAYQKDMLGVVATSPGIVLGDPGTNGYPVALVGRVPVKVTNENGQIYAGDRLTSATRSGYAMRATQAGRVLGQSLSDAVDWTVCEGEDPASSDALLCTTVLVFVNLTDYTGQSVELAMTERHQTDSTLGSDGLVGSATIDGVEQGLGSDTASVRLATSAPTKQEQILSFLKEIRDKEVGRVSSEVFTGRVSASTEVITPTLYADQIFAKSIKADSIEGLSIWTNQIASLQEKYAGLQPEATKENVVVSGVGATEKTLLNLDRFTVGSLVASLDASVLGKLTLAGGMTVGGSAQFNGETTFTRLASFFGKAIFKESVSFEKTPTFGGDTAGFAVIEKGAKKVRVMFGTPYEKQPIVTVTLTNDASPLLADADESLKKDIEVLEKEYLESVFDKDIRYIVTEKSAKGFTLVLSEKAPKDLQFSWIAFSVDQAKSFNSEKEKQEEVLPVISEEAVSVPAPTPVDTTSLEENITGVPPVLEEIAPLVVPSPLEGEKDTL